MSDQAGRTSSIFAGPSEMHARTRAHDWASSPLGPVECWPQSLRSVVKTLLASRYPMVLTWGPQLIQFYNDAYSRLIGDKHPAALGEDIRITLAEGWETLGPLIREVMTSGVANWNPALLLVLERAGYREEAYFDVSHAPAEDDDGRIVGMLGVCSEVTQEVLGERRLRLLRDLAFRAGDARTVEQACRDVAACIAEHPLDVPFALLYLRDGEQLRLYETVGLRAGGPASPELIELAADTAAVWPAVEVAAGQTVVIEDVQRRLDLRGGPWSEPVTTALALPIAAVGQARPRGVLIAGVSPNRALDESYRSFYQLLIGQVSAAVRNAQAYEDERQRAAALAELDRAKTRFFSNVSHEFRTPLTLMLGPLEELLVGAQDGTLSAGQRENLSVAHRNALRLLKLVNTLLDFSRIEAERAQALYAPVDLAMLTADLASLFRAAIEKAGLEFVVDCPPIAAPVYVDSEMWEKIVLNLLSNAFKFTQRGRIVLRQRLVDGEVELSVADTGCGIPAAEVEHVFTRFHRIAGAQGRSHEGSGIGLALVRDLVQLHGGAVRVESRVDQGSTFTVTLPIGSAHLPADRVKAVATQSTSRAEAFVAEAERWMPDDAVWDVPAEAEPPPIERLASDDGVPRGRVLLADDNADMRAYIRRILEPRYDVIVVSDGAAALRLARAQLPDLVLSDVMMPQLDGVGLLAELRADPRTRTIPVILLSARAGEEARATGLETGADDYLIKPFAARELLARVTTHLDLARIRRLAAEERTRRSAAEALAQEREQFLSLAAHELKTPLTSIRGYIDLLIRRTQRSSTLSEREERMLRSLSQQVDRLTTLVAVLLDLSRLETGPFMLDRRQLDLGPLVRRVCDQVELTLDRHQLELRLPDEPLLIWGDDLRLEQVLQNLLSNAVKYSPLGGLIQVMAERREAEICVHVRDQGIGIPEAARAQVFERFYRAGNAGEQHIGGLGIGLYVVNEIVAQHGGTVQISSQEGSGSTFTVCLPPADLAEVGPDVRR